MANYTELGNGVLYKKEEDGSIRITSSKHLRDGDEANNSALVTVEQLKELLDERPRVMELGVGHVLCDYSYRNASYKFFTYDGHVATARKRHIEAVVDDVTAVSVKERVEQYADEHPCITELRYFREENKRGNSTAYFSIEVSDGESFGESNIGTCRTEHEKSLEDDGYVIDVRCVEHDIDGGWNVATDIVSTDE